MSRSSPSRLRVLLICSSICANSCVSCLSVAPHQCVIILQTLCRRNLHVSCLLSCLGIHPETNSTTAYDHCISVSTSIRNSACISLTSSHQRNNWTVSLLTNCWQDFRPIRFFYVFSHWGSMLFHFIYLQCFGD
jgi:hypothetical protein